MLCTITFEVKAEGATPLHFEDTELNTVAGEPNNPIVDPIPHTAVDGGFEYPLKDHDIAVTDVTAFPLTVPVGQSVSINATVKNEGEVPENFEVNVYHNYTVPEWSVIDSITVTDLAPEDSKTVTFSWIPSYNGTFIIKVEVPDIPGETTQPTTPKSSMTRCS